MGKPKRKRNQGDKNEGARDFEAHMEQVEVWIGRVQDGIEDNSLIKAMTALNEATYHLGFAANALEYAFWERGWDQNLHRRFDQFQREREGWAKEVLDEFKLED